MRKTILLVAALALGACVNVPTTEELAAADEATCAGYGLKPGSERFGECRLILAQIRAQERLSQAAAAAALAPTSNYWLGQMGQPHIPFRQPMACVSSPSGGGYVSTDCY